MSGGRWSLVGQNALVTGGTKGIGKAIAKELAQLGAKVFICARTQADVDACVEEWTREGLSISGTAADVNVEEDRSALIEKVSATFGGVLHILVNNVGTSVRRATAEYSAEEFRRVMSVNFDSIFYLSQLAYPLLKEAKRSSVINIGSVAGVTAIKSGTPYAASKAAMHKLTQNLGCEWAKDGVRVNCVAPWYTETPLAAPVLTDKVKMAEILGRTPMGRIAQPEEVSGLVAFLCMAPASYITSQVICVDGGFTANGWMM